MNYTEEYEKLVTSIVDIEERMFLEAAAPTDPDCARRIDDMRLHRSSQFAGWSEETLASYLKDLHHAEEIGGNLMILKYARMSDSIPRLSNNPRIPEILEVFVAWQKQFIDDYPAVMRRGRDLDDFRNYLSGELETYSAATLRLLSADVERYLAEERSMTVDIYERMASLAGYSSLREMENAFSQK